MVLILLAIPPFPLPCPMLLINASSNALWVTLASSRSEKLDPMLGVPSLPSLAFPPGFRRGERPAACSSAARRGESGPGGRGWLMGVLVVLSCGVGLTLLAESGGGSEEAELVGEVGCKPSGCGRDVTRSIVPRRWDLGLCV